jgi:zinc transport system permease protein
VDFLHYTFFQHALWGSLFTCIACGIAGTYIVAKRLVFISGGITHASFGGLGLGFWLGINPIFSALVFSAISALGVEWLSKKHDVREDSAIAAVWSLGMATGVICIFLTPGYTPNISAYLFGNILTVTRADLWMIGGMAAMLIAGFCLFFNRILYTAFDREFAQTKGIRVRLIEQLMMLAIAFTIVCSIRLIGIMLLLSLLTLPQMTVNLFTSRFKSMIYGSILVGLAGCISGLFLSYYINVPSGATIIFVLVILFLICKTGIFFRRRLYRRNDLKQGNNS